MARTCDSCDQLIEQKDNEFVEVTARVLDATENSEQDEKAQAYGDFCDGCIANGKAIAMLLQRVDWALEPKP